MSLLFEDSNCNTVHWEEIPITVCWEIDKAKFVCSDSQKLPVIGDKILISVACELAYINSTIKLAVKELNSGKEVHSFDITINAPKPSSLTLKKEWKNKTLVLACENPEYTGYDSPIRVGSEVLKGVALCYTDWNKVTFDDFAFNEDAKKRRADEYIKIRMETSCGKNGIEVKELPDYIKKHLKKSEPCKNGIKALVEDERLFEIIFTPYPLFIKKDESSYLRVYGTAYGVQLWMTSYLEDELDLQKVRVVGNRKVIHKMKKESISQGIHNMKRDDEFILSGLFCYFYQFEGEDDPKFIAYFDDKDSIMSDKTLNRKEKDRQIAQLNAELKKRRRKLSYEEAITSVGAHEETHLFQSKGNKNEITAYYIEYKNITKCKTSSSD